MNVKKKKSSWILDKFIKAKIENDKKVNSIIKHNNDNKGSFNLMIKDMIMSEKIKNNTLLKDVQKRLNSLTINRESMKDLKNQNETFKKQFSNIKTFNKNYIKSNDKKIGYYPILEDLVLKYKAKGYKIPKLSQGDNNIFKQEPILISNNNIQNIYESIMYNPKSKKNLYYLQKTKSLIDDMILNKNNRKKVIREKNKENKENDNKSCSLLNNGKLNLNLLSFEKSNIGLFNNNISNISNNINNNENTIKPYNNKTSIHKLLKNKGSNSMTNITIKTNFSLKNKDFKKLLLKKLQENKTSKTSEKELELSTNIINSYEKENDHNILLNKTSLSYENNYINGIKYYNEEEKQILLEINDLINNIKNIEEERNISSVNITKIKNMFTKFTPIQSDRKKSVVVNGSKKNIIEKLSLTRYKSSDIHKFLNNFNFKNRKNSLIDKDNIQSIINKSENKFPEINNMRVNSKLIFEKIKSEEEFFQYIEGVIKKKNFVKVFYLLKLFLKKFRHLSNEEIDKLININEKKTSISILDEIKKIKKIIIKKKIYDKTKTLYVRNNSFQNIHHKMDNLFENDKKITELDHCFLKILNQ